MLLADGGEDYLVSGLFRFLHGGAEMKGGFGVHDQLCSLVRDCLLQKMLKLGHSVYGIGSAQELSSVYALRNYSGHAEGLAYWMG